MYSLLARTGYTEGKENMMRVKAVQASRTMLENKPIGPIQKGPWGMLLRPRMRRQVMGMA
jgi:hypothetical protein